MEYAWNMNMYGICMEYLGMSMEYVWTLSGIRMYGLCMEYVLNIYGICMDDVWKMYGRYMEDV